MIRASNPTTVWIAAAVAGLSLAGCAAFGRGPDLSWMKVSPMVSATAEARPADGYYQSAVIAIEDRDYAHAIHLLQLAKMKDPKDVRAWNALGVVYDKLGRTDVAARYYKEALRLEPGSRIVLANLAYSARLTAAAAGQSQPPVAVAPLAAAPAPEVPVPPPIDHAVAARPPETAPARPLTIVDATGSRDGAEPFRARLAQLGWTSPPKAVQSGPVQAHSVIYFSQARARDAKGLAATLGGAIQTRPCEDCFGIRLVLGSDALRRSGSIATRRTSV